MPTRRHAIAALFAASVISAHGAGFPEKPVQIIVPYAAGGPTDVVARTLAEGLGEVWGQRVLVVNKPGASGMLGVQALTAAPPDGYTLMLTASSAFVIYPATLDKPPYDSAKDFTPLTSISYSDLMLVVKESSPVKSVRDLIGHAKANPGKVSYGSAGIGAMNHIGGELLKRTSQTDLVHVPYKGDAPVVADLLSGELTMSFLSSQLAIPQVKAGKLRALAVSGPNRMAAYPDIPTMMESGVKDFNLVAWNGLVGPAGMAPALAEQINEAVVKVMGRPAVVARLGELGLVSDTSSTRAFGDRLRAETDRWRAFIKTAGIRAQQ